MGQVTTFYSYKGGSGRSMAMANVAWALASNGSKVLVIDWDLEAPGLHRYFHPFLADPEQQHSRGLIDRLWQYIETLDETDVTKRFVLANCDEIVQNLELPLRGKGQIDLLSAGCQDDFYSERVGGLDWTSFYARFDGEAFIDALMSWARKAYDHVLIDSRTGVADTAGICTTQIPDNLVMCFVYNRQSIEGTAAVAGSVVRDRKQRKQTRLDIRFVPSRVEERSTVDAARGHAAVRLASALNTRISHFEKVLRRDEIRHYPWCAFEEKLAVFEDVPGERGSLLDAMHALAGRIVEKNLKTHTISPDVLTAYWRRAAFDDPRIAELSALKIGPVEAYWRRLLGWVEDAVVNSDERIDWLMELAEASVEVAGLGNDQLSHGDSEFLARSGMDLGERAFRLDTGQFWLRYGLLLQKRSGQRLKRGDAEEALRDAEHAAELFKSHPDGLSRWRYARALEFVAQAHEAGNSRQEALETYRRSAIAFESLNRRQIPHGNEIDQARAWRQLAEKLIGARQFADAMRASMSAVERLADLDETTVKRNQAEVVNCLGVLADTAVMLDPHRAQIEFERVRQAGKERLATSADLERLSSRLNLAQARHALRVGRNDEAQAFVEAFDDGQIQEDDRLLELRARLLLNDNRPDEAANLIIGAIDGSTLLLNGTLFDILSRSLIKSGRDKELFPLVLRNALASNFDEPISVADVFEKIIGENPTSESVTANFLAWSAGRTPGRDQLQALARKPKKS